MTEHREAGAHTLVDAFVTMTLVTCAGLKKMKDETTIDYGRIEAEVLLEKLKLFLKTEFGVGMYD